MAKERMCPNCGNYVVPEKKVRGSFFFEIILWIFFIIPGLIYSIWRLTTKFIACPICENVNLVPIDSPKGKQLMVDFMKNQSP